jgi:tetratricopeptide (TPR) repeat protein
VRLAGAVIAVLISGALAPPASAQSLRDTAYRLEIVEGLTHIYRLEHDDAIQFFTELGQRHPEHPGPPLAKAVTIWLRELFRRQELDLDRFISPGYFTKPAKREMPEADRQAFLDGVAKSQELATAYLAKHPGDKDARYYLGGAEGARGAFAFTIERSYIKALRHGKKAYQYQKALVDEDPEYYDSYMTVGTYEYVLGNIPWYLKWITSIAGYRGSEQRGFEYLVLAADRGMFVGNDARVLLMALYVREKYYEYALQVAQHLHRRYPENFLLHLNQAQILERMKKREEAARIYTEVVQFAEEGKPNYRKIPLGTFRYTAGRRLMELGYRNQALELFLGATRDPSTPPRERALSHLRAGEILDLMGERADAVSQYKMVRNLDEFEGSHRRASKFLKSPSRQ